MEHFEKTLSSEIIYKGRIIDVIRDTVELENGKQAKREVVCHSGGVAVLAIDDEDNVLFVRQFRYPYADVLIELPAGKLEPGEDPMECGKRELEEETGHIAKEFSFIGKAYPTPGYTTEVLYLYLAKGLSATRQRLDEDEFLTVAKFPFKKAVEMCLNGEIVDAKTMVAILMHNVGRHESGMNG